MSEIATKLITTQITLTAKQNVNREVYNYYLFFTEIVMEIFELARKWNVSNIFYLNSPSLTKQPSFRCATP